MPFIGVAFMYHFDKCGLTDYVTLLVNIQDVLKIIIYPNQDHFYVCYGW